MHTCTCIHCSCTTDTCTCTCTVHADNTCTCTLYVLYYTPVHDWCLPLIFKLDVLPHPHPHLWSNEWLTLSTADLTASGVLPVMRAWRGSSSPGCGSPALPSFPSFVAPLPRIMIFVWVCRWGENCKKDIYMKIVKKTYTCWWTWTLYMYNVPIHNTYTCTCIYDQEGNA